MSSAAVVYYSLRPKWWAFALRGVAAIALGIVAMLVPAAAVLAMAIVAGVYALLDGLMYLIVAATRPVPQRHWWTSVLYGLIGMIAGAVVLVTPWVAGVALATFLWVALAVWACATGIVELVAALRLRREIQGEWLLALNGVLSVLLGIFLFAWLGLHPVAGMVAFGWAIGVYALISGVVLLSLALRLRKLPTQADVIAVTSSNP
jgi:uncharacterized membrane protein HdeD (DUF308 family)